MQYSGYSTARHKNSTVGFPIRASGCRRADFPKSKFNLLYEYDDYGQPSAVKRH